MSHYELLVRARKGQRIDTELVSEVSGDLLKDPPVSAGGDVHSLGQAIDILDAFGEPSGGPSGAQGHPGVGPGGTEVEAQPSGGVRGGGPPR